MLTSQLTRGIRLAGRSAGALVPKVRRVGASVLRAAPIRTVGKGAALGVGIAATGIGAGFAVDSVRKGFYNPRSESFPETLINGISPEEAEDDRRVRAANAPTAAEFFTGNKFLLVVLLAVVAFAVLNPKRRR